MQQIGRLHAHEMIAKSTNFAEIAPISLFYLIPVLFASPR